MKKLLFAVLLGASSTAFAYTEDQYAKDMADRYAKRDPAVVALYDRMDAIREARLAAANKVDSTSMATATNTGNNQTVVFSSPSDTTVRNVPSMSAPLLSSSGDTCMGSSSGSFSAPGIGVSIGSTWTDSNCKMLKNAREMWNMGLHKAAFAMLCKDLDNRDALEASGLKCPAVKEMQR